ncbi:MAG TPA: hypothetical protein ENI87_09475 [bacterium]|nr:hypothetical protein [bacterium]
MSGHAAIAAGRFLTFRVDGSDYAVPTNRVREVTPLRTIAEVPNGTEALVGTMDLRGEILPVVDLRTVLGAEGTTEPDARAVILVLKPAAGGRSGDLGVLVERIGSRVELAPDEILPPPEVCGRQMAECVAAVARIGEQRACILDVDTLLALDGGGARGDDAGVGEPVASTASAPPRLKLLSFFLGEQQLAIRSTQIVCVQPAPELQADGYMPEFLCGFGFRDGVRFGVVDMAERFGVADAADDPRATLIVRCGDNEVGLLADRVGTLVEVEEREIQSSARFDELLADARLTRGFVTREGAPIQVLDPDGLLTAAQRRELLRWSRAMAAIQLHDQTVHRAGMPGPEPVIDADRERLAGNYLCALCDGVELAIPSRCVLEVLEGKDLDAVPLAEPDLLGLLKVRGESHPVLDTAGRIGYGRRIRDRDDVEDLRPVVVLLRTDERPVGLLVDQILGLKRIAADQLLGREASELPVFEHLLRSVAEVDGRKVYLIDVDAVLQREGRSLVEEFERFRAEVRDPRGFDTLAALLRDGGWMSVEVGEEGDPR